MTVLRQTRNVTFEQGQGSIAVFCSDRQCTMLAWLANVTYIALKSSRKSQRDDAITGFGYEQIFMTLQVLCSVGDSRPVVHVKLRRCQAYIHVPVPYCQARAPAHHRFTSSSRHAAEITAFFCLVGMTYLRLECFFGRNAVDFCAVKN